MALEPGTRLGVYEITGQLGVGGMGEVYRAHDTKLGRDVAIKVVLESLVEDADRAARFQREARSLAALNHPNIATLHGMEEIDGLHFLVMELVAGDDLSHRIAQGAMPIEDALPIARQIAEALEAAHEAGIIHRDLKPANVKVKDDGTVKVLDFGLAKAMEPDGNGAAEATPYGAANSPTLTARATQLGMIIGTAAYMAPEQAKGKRVDKRADIWAFGVVFFEMLTGRRAFEGEDVSEALASVLAREPDMSALSSNLPAPVRRLLTRCLQKDPKRRLRDIGEGMLQLDDAMSSAADTEVTAVTAPVRGGYSVTHMIGALVLSGAVVGAAVWMLKPAPAEPVRNPERFALTIPGGGWVDLSRAGSDVAISPDGSMVVFRLDGALYLRRLGAFESELIRGTEGALFPFFSPDGEWVGFQTLDRVLKRISILGGSPDTLAVLDEFIVGASWSRDDTVVYATQAEQNLWRVPAVGGDPVSVLPAAEVGQRGYRWPEVLPSGRQVLFTAVTATSGTSGSIAVLDLDTGVITDLVLGGANPRYASSGHIVYVVDGTLRAVAFDAERLMVTGSPVPIVQDVSTKSTLAGNFAISANGTLAYVSGGGTGGISSSLVIADREGLEQIVSPEPDGYAHPRVSPDGQQLAVERPGPNGRDIWIWDLRRGGWRQFTFEDGNDSSPIWTPDGRRIVFSSRREPPGLFVKNADGTGQVEPLVAGVGLAPFSWSADGTQLIIEEGNRISTVSMTGDHAITPLIEETFDTEYPRVSPNGKWIAYKAEVPAQGDRIFVRPFPDVDRQVQVSPDEGDDPVWSPDSRELYYMNALDQVSAVTITSDPDLSAGVPTVILERGYIQSGGVQYDVMPDGRFLVLKEGGATDGDQELVANRLLVVLNWFEELKAKATVR